MSKQVDQILNKVLKSLKADVQRGGVAEKGLCSAVMNRVGGALKARNAGKHACAFRLTELICTWPDTNDTVNTLEAVCKYEQYAAEAQAGTSWQNPRRLALLDWMIKETSK